jgi:hypothetical protein
MSDIQAVIDSSEKILRRVANYSGEYSIPFSRITFSYEDPLSYKVPYNLSVNEFISKSSEIEKALTGNHEIAHFIQLWSTTNGLLQFLYIINIHEQLAHINEEKKFKLPLQKYFNQVLLKVKEKKIRPS